MNGDQTIHTPDGRRITLRQYGDARGQPVFYCHGLPSSRLEAELISPTVEKMGIRMIAIDRRGYGQSDPRPPSRLCDWAEDLEQVAGHLGIAEFKIVGVSGGGPYALACGWHLGSKVKRIALVCPLGRVTSARLRHRISPAARLAFFLALHAPWALRMFFGNPTAKLVYHWPQLAFDLMDKGLPEKDRLTLGNPELRKVFEASVREGLCRGATGVLCDFIHYTRPWGVDFSSITQPVSLWHGEADTVVPVAHSQDLARRLLHSKLTILPGEGHYSLPVGHAKKILQDLCGFIPPTAGTDCAAWPRERPTATPAPRQVNRER